MKNNFFPSGKIYLLLQISLIVSILAGIKNSEAFYKWTDEKGVVHFSDTPVNRKQAETAKIEVKMLKKYTDDFEGILLEPNWLKKNIFSNESVNLSGKKGFLKLGSNGSSNIDEGLKMPIIYRTINCKDCDIKLYVDYQEVSPEFEKIYSGLVFFQDQVENSWFLFGARSEKIKSVNINSGAYKEILAKKISKKIKHIVFLVKKRGKLFSFYFSEDDSKWKELGTKSSNMETFNVGIFSETNSKGVSKVLFDKFSYTISDVTQ